MWPPAPKTRGIDRLPVGQFQVPWRLLPHERHRLVPLRFPALQAGVLHGPGHDRDDRDDRDVLPAAQEMRRVLATPKRPRWVVWMIRLPGAAVDPESLAGGVASAGGVPAPVVPHVRRAPAGQGAPDAGGAHPALPDQVAALAGRAAPGDRAHHDPARERAGYGLHAAVRDGPVVQLWRLAQARIADCHGTSRISCL